MKTGKKQMRRSGIATLPLLGMLTLFLITLLPVRGYTQACTSYTNFDIRPTMADTLSCDNFVDKNWGDCSKSTTNTSSSPTLEIQLKGAIGSSQTDIQHILLTADNKIWSRESAEVVMPTSFGPTW